MEKITDWTCAIQLLSSLYPFSSRSKSLITLWPLLLSSLEGSEYKSTVKSLSQTAQSLLESTPGCFWMRHLHLSFCACSLQHCLILSNTVHFNCTSQKDSWTEATHAYFHIWCLQLIIIITIPPPSLPQPTTHQYNIHTEKDERATFRTRLPNTAGNW